MVRPIKFRAWDGKRMVEPELITSDGMAAHESHGISVEDWPIMQFTGLHDKNGKEIYFDDVVAFEFHDKENPNENYSGQARIAETLTFGAGIHYEWNDAASELFAATEGGQIAELWDDEELWTLEVIGNIYENPELTKGAND